jgi:hypothetical protein
MPITINWILLALALALLLVPIAVFHGERVRYRALMRDWDGYWGRTLTLGLHAIDLLRSMLGVWLLAEALRRAPEAQGALRYAAVAAQGGVLCVATLLQAAFCKEPETAHAPFAFIIGLTLVHVPPPVAGFSLVLAGALALGANSPTGFFPVLALGVVGTGFLFEGKKLVFECAVLAAAILMPWLFTLLFPRHFVCSYRAKRRTEPPPPPPR